LKEIHGAGGDFDASFTGHRSVENAGEARQLKGIEGAN
jgi:hypothetical protein